MAKENSKGWFRGPNAIFEQEGLSVYAGYIYLYLCRRSNKQNQCFPSRPTIAKDCNIKSIETVRKAINELINRGLISKENRVSKNGKTSNLYTVYDPPTQQLSSDLRDSHARHTSTGQPLDSRPDDHNIAVRQPLDSCPDDHNIAVRQPLDSCPDDHNIAVRQPLGGRRRATQFKGDSLEGLTTTEGLPTMRASERERLEKDPPAPAGASKKCVHGRYGLIQLTAAEYNELVEEHGREKVEDYINRVDEHMSSNGKEYKNHAATIRKWIRQDDAKAAAENLSRNFNASRAVLAQSKPSSRTERDWEKLERLDQEYILRFAGSVDGDDDGEDDINGEKNPPAPSGASEKCAHGRYGLIKLTAAEYDELVKEHGREKVEDYINRVDEHMSAEGREYKNHAAVIRKWIRQDDAKAAEKKAKEEKWAEEKRIKNGHSKPSKRTPEQWKELERKEREYIIRTAGGDDDDEDDINIEDDEDWGDSI